MSRTTLDIISYCTLGVDLSITLTPSVFHDCYQKALDPPAFGQILMGLSGYFPAVRSLPFEENRIYKSANETIRSEILAFVRERQSELAGKSASETDRDDFLSYMILESQAVGDPWSEDKILQNVLNFFTAGHETSATSLVWMIHALSIHPDIQEKLRDEASELLGRKPNPEYMDLEGLSYLDNFCKETLRLYSPGLSVAREPTCDVEISGIVIPKGTPISIFPTLINRNPEIWGPDADDFKPDRWNNLTGQASDPNAMMSFMLGPRSCMGRVFAILEMKMLLAELLTNFRLEPAVDEKDIELHNPTLALRVQGGLKVRFHRL